MAEKNEVSKADCLQRLAPDFSIIDKAEKAYWTSHSEFDSGFDAGWYKIYKMTAGQTSIETDAYRGMFCSEEELDFYSEIGTGSSKYSSSYGITETKNRYGSRYVYVVVVDDSDKFHKHIIFKRSAQGQPTGDCFVTGVFF